MGIEPTTSGLDITFIEQQLIDGEGNGAVKKRGKNLARKWLVKALCTLGGKPFFIHFEITIRFDMSLFGYSSYDTKPRFE